MSKRRLLVLVLAFAQQACRPYETDAPNEWQDPPRAFVPYHARPLISDLQSNYGKDEVVVEIWGKDPAEINALSQEIQRNSSLTELDSGVAIALEITQTVTPDGLMLLHFRPETWDKNKWHKFRIKEPSVGGIEGGPQVGGYFGARFIYVSYLTAGCVRVNGKYRDVFGDALLIGLSEKTPRPSTDDIAVSQNGTRLKCDLPTTIGGSVVNTAPPSWSWTLTCSNVDWNQQIDVRVSGTFAGAELRDLQGNPGWSTTVKLPSDYGSQAKWSYQFPPYGTGL